MKIRELIGKLLDYDLDTEVVISEVDYNYELELEFDGDIDMYGAIYLTKGEKVQLDD